MCYHEFNQNSSEKNIRRRQYIMMKDNEVLKKLEELEKELKNLGGKIVALKGEYTSRKGDVEEPVEYNEEKVVTDYLMQLRMPTNLLGFKYSRAAIIILLNGEQEKRMYITKKLYPDVANQFGTTSSRVERAIRHMIRTSYEKNRNNNVLLQEIAMNTRGCYPTNSEFLAFIAEKIRLESES